MRPFSLRPVTAEDYEFLLDLQLTTMRECVEATWGWIEEDQRNRFRERFAPGNGQVIVFDGKDVGFVLVEEKGDELFLAEIQIAHDMQDRGIGSAVVRDLIEKAMGMNLLLVLTVLRANRAKKLYDRLGFQVVNEDDEGFYMRWPPE